MQVRTPLNGCLASAEMLLETSLGAEQRELARTIRVSGSILLSTVSNFLDFFKLEAGKPLDVVRREINVQVRSHRRSTATAKRRQGRSDCLVASLPVSGCAGHAWIQCQTPLHVMSRVIRRS